MSKNLIGVSIVAALTILIIYLINLNAIQRPAEQAKNDHWAEQAQTAPENFFLVCPPSQDGKPISPKQCKRQGQYEYDRNQQIIDHKAQVSMRNAAWSGFFLGIIGMILLGWTLIETRKASNSATRTLDVARNATKAEFQPYIAFPQEIRITLGSMKSTDDVYKIRSIVDAVTIINKGQTPANNMIVHSDAVFNYGKFGRFTVESKPVKIISDVLVDVHYKISFEFVTDEVPSAIGQNYTTDDAVIKIKVIFDDMFTKGRVYLAVYKKNLPVNLAQLQSVKEIKKA